MFKNITTKQASNSPVTYVTHKHLAVLFFQPTCCAKLTNNNKRAGDDPVVPRALSFFPLPSLLATQKGFCGGQSAQVLLGFFGCAFPMMLLTLTPKYSQEALRQQAEVTNVI